MSYITSSVYYKRSKLKERFSLQYFVTREKRHRKYWLVCRLKKTHTSNNINVISWFFSFTQCNSINLKNLNL